LDFIFLRAKILLDHPGSADRDLGWEFSNPLFISNPEYPVNTEYFFPDLPGAEKEINNALPYANRYTLLKGKQVIKDTVLKYLNGSDLAYFATHGVADIKDPMAKSYLVLSGADPFFTSMEIQDLRLDSNYHAPEMIILSACQTGLGKAMEAGLAGSLARSFILSGSSFVIESLWNVDDNATAFLMNRFMFYCSEKTQHFPAGALRLAILDTKSKFPSPL
jgi:CHAT domain-containing protein